MADDDIANGILEGLKEAIEWKRGTLALETVNFDPMPASKIKEIRKRYAKSTKAFEKRFGIPASTMNNWEQGRRKPDPAARLLLRIIEQSPEAAEKAAQAA
ncbi:transcriptional regulator [Rhizobium sp. TH2]|uniref:helix-turn-helix domain-containing protein n=1 Tax=Rhizobium sp. TH2 TaxID=2775403 RepID=UPI0021586AC6|nr:transcriptional regulator [Rhizobium sp. TH2]UVC07571.1 transcriptional regulator [Rhizobium sp. TH2]